MMSRKENSSCSKVQDVPSLVVTHVLPSPTGACCLPKPLCLISHLIKQPFPTEGKMETVLERVPLQQKTLKISSDRIRHGRRP